MVCRTSYWNCLLEVWVDVRKVDESVEMLQLLPFPFYIDFGTAIYVTSWAMEFNRPRPIFALLGFSIL